MNFAGQSECFAESFVDRSHSRTHLRAITHAYTLALNVLETGALTFSRFYIELTTVPCISTITG